MTTLKTLRLQYGQIPMQYEVQHCTLREHEDADPEMVGPYTYTTSPHHLAPARWLECTQKGIENEIVLAARQVRGVCSLFAHVLPRLTRSEISDSVTGPKCSCLIAVRRCELACRRAALYTRILSVRAWQLVLHPCVCVCVCAYICVCVCVCVCPSTVSHSTRTPTRNSRTHTIYHYH